MSSRIFYPRIPRIEWEITRSLRAFGYSTTGNFENLLVNSGEKFSRSLFQKIAAHSTAYPR